MMIFLTIILSLIGANAIFMFFSLSGLSHREHKTIKNQTSETTSNVYPIDLITSNYKKAV
jgi:flagellar basal body-associated protein FliL